MKRSELEYPYNLIEDLNLGSYSERMLRGGELKQAMESVLLTLKDEEQNVISLLYKDRKLCAEVGVLIGKSGTSVSQTRIAAILKLRHPARFKQLLLMRD